MTRKDFELITNVLKAAKPAVPPPPASKAALDVFHGRKGMWGEVVLAFANELPKTSPRFDRERFLRACGVELV